MIQVLIFKESRFPADRLKIKTFVENYLEKKVHGAAEVGINIVGDRKMKSLNSKYRNLNKTTDVLSFPLADPHSPQRTELKTGFTSEKSAPDKVLRLGDVVISYPQSVLAAAKSDKLVDQKIEELIAHGLDHLLGIHHE